MVKLAIIDFCETIANFQTLDPFLEFVLLNERTMAYRILSNKATKFFLGLLTRILFHFGHCHIIRKKVMVMAMKNVSVKKLNEYGETYYTSRVRPCLIPETIKLIEQFKMDGYSTVIVSGGSQFYIQYFMRDYGIDGIVSTEIEIKNGKCTGRLLRECLRTEKVEMLNEYIRENNLSVIEKVCVTDSESDLPLLSVCERKIVISHNAHSKWVTKDMEEIIWE